MGNMDVHFSSKTDEWATPQRLFDKLSEKYGPFVLDVCATAENSKCEVYFGLDNGRDGLKESWAKWSLYDGASGMCWMNPPYSKPENACSESCQKKNCIERGYHRTEYKPGMIDWVKKAYEESKNGCTVVCLLPARTDTKFFHDYCTKGDVEFLRGRLKFGDAKNSAPFPSMIVIFKAKPGEER